MQFGTNSGPAREFNWWQLIKNKFSHFRMSTAKQSERSAKSHDDFDGGNWPATSSRLDRSFFRTKSEIQRTDRRVKCEFNLSACNRPVGHLR